MLNVYLSGEIHSDWREEIIQLCEEENLDIKEEKNIGFLSKFDFIKNILRNIFNSFRN